MIHVLSTLVHVLLMSGFVGTLVLEVAVVTVAGLPAVLAPLVGAVGHGLVRSVG